MHLLLNQLINYLHKFLIYLLYIHTFYRNAVTYNIQLHKMIIPFCKA